MAIRSLVISQRLLGTAEIMLIHHTDCWMMIFHEGEVKDAIQADTACDPPSPWRTSATWRVMCASRQTRRSGKSPPRGRRAPNTPRL